MVQKFKQVFAIDYFHSAIGIGGGKSGGYAEALLGPLDVVSQFGRVKVVDHGVAEACIDKEDLTGPFQFVPQVPAERYQTEYDERLFENANVAFDRLLGRERYLKEIVSSE